MNSMRLTMLLGSVSGITSLVSDTIITIALCVLTVLSVCLFVWMVSAGMEKPAKNNLLDQSIVATDKNTSDKPNSTQKTMIGAVKITSLVWIVAIVGIILRAGLSFTSNGYIGTAPESGAFTTGGLSEIIQSLNSIMQSGVADYYGYGYNVYPLHVYLTLPFVGILNVFSGFNTSELSAITLLFVKIPFIICDAVSCIVLFKITKKYNSQVVALAVSALYALCPVFFFASGIWGSSMSILSLLFILSIYFMTQKNFLGLTISYALALLSAKEAVLLLPVFAVFYAYHFVKAFKANFKQPVLGLKEFFKHSERGMMLKIPLYLVCALIGMYLINLPLLKMYDYSFAAWFKMIYIKPFTDLKFFSFNALSVYNLFGKNNAPMTSVIPEWLFSLMFLAIVVLLVLVIYLARKNRANLALVAAFILATLNVYFMDFKEMSILPFFAVLLVCFALIKDKRLLHIFAGFAFVFMLNACAVMVNAGFFSLSSFADFKVTDYTGSALLSSTTFGDVISIICGALAMLVHFYMIMVVLDISLSNKRRFLTPTNSFIESQKVFFKFKEKKASKTSK